VRGASVRVEEQGDIVRGHQGLPLANSCRRREVDAVGTRDGRWAA